MIAAAREALKSLEEADPTVDERVIRWLQLSDSVDLDAVTLGQLIGVTTSRAERIAEVLAANDVFSRREVRVCASDECGVTLSKESLDLHWCQTCGASFDELEPHGAIRYLLERPRSRDVGWLIALHGVRTLGRWQEQMQWLVDRQFRRTVPFKNWKYGRVLLAALIPPLQRRVVRRFVAEVREARTELQGVLCAGATPAPDVIAHSFGSWIIAHALEEDAELCLGNVILVGSIVRPDWPWEAPLDRGQVAALLNYCGDRDPWVRLAERFVPDAGPSGVIGFSRPHDRLTNVLRPGGSHSSAFAPELLTSTFEDVWRPFIANRVGDVDTREHEFIAPSCWSRATLVLRAPTSLLLALILLSGVVAIVAIAMSS